MVESERLIARRFQMTDNVDLHEVLGDDEVMKNIEQPFSFFETREFITKHGMIDNPNIFALEEKYSRKVIGYIVFHCAEEEEVYELGCVLGRKHWRKGYAIEISKAILAHAFNDMGIHKIICETTDTAKVLPLVKKLGMQQEALMRKHCKRNGDWRDLYWFALLKEDFRVNNPGF